MKKSDSIASISKALAAVQAVVESPRKTKTASAGSYSYNYADLADAVDAARPHLQPNGLAYVQEATSKDSACGVATLLMHSSGEWIETEPLHLPAGNSPQSFGSAITYARRYSLCCVLGIVAEEDDDGQAAKPSRKPKKTGEVGGGPKAAVGTKDPADLLRSKVVETAKAQGIEPDTAKRLLASWFQGVSASKDLDEMQCKAAIEGFENYGKTLKEVNELGTAAGHSTEELLLVASAERADPIKSLQELSLDELRGVRDGLKLPKAADVPS